MDLGGPRGPEAEGPEEELLTVRSVEGALPGRPVRVHRGVVSTEADARAWAHRGAPAGAVVVAEHQIAARGRSGHPWVVRSGTDLGLSLVLRPELPAEREGWIWLVGGLAVGRALAADHDVHWPDDVRGGRDLAGTVVVHADLRGGKIDAAVLSALLVAPEPGRTTALGRFVEAVEGLLSAPVEEVLDHYRDRCTTLGRQLRARMLPLTPDAVTIEGRAVDVRADGSIVLETPDDRRAAVPPPALGALEEIGDD